MSETGVRVFIPDPTHGEGDWSDAEGKYIGGPSAEFRRQLEAEYGEAFDVTSIGTGAALAGVPKSFQLQGFVVQHRLRFADPGNLPDTGRLTTIEPAPGRMERVERASVYVFQVIADGREFRVRVDGHNVEFLQE
jgi:hypothetical protein